MNICTCKRSVPNNLNWPEGGQTKDFLDRYTNEENFFSSVIIGDEYDPETKRQGVDTANPPPKTKKKLKWANRRLNHCWNVFDWTVIVSTETVNKVFVKTSLKESENLSFAWDLILQTNGCSIMRTPHITLRSPSQNVCPTKAFLWFPSRFINCTLLSVSELN